MLKYGLLAAGIASIGLILWPLLSSLGNQPNAAANLVNATEKTNNQADALNDSFTDVIPPAPAGPGPGNASGIPLHPQDDGSTSADFGEEDPNAEPTPDPYAAYAHPSEHAVRDAMEYLNTLQTELNPQPTEYIRAVEQLQRAWEPRYEQAVQEYKRFAYRIDHADAMANEYFTIQNNLTSHITDTQERERWERIDIAERGIYMDWREQAFQTLGQARLIMDKLHNMNIVITKQRLSANFAAVYDEFQTIPPAITQLHQELERFQAESDHIQRTFGPSVN